MFDLSSPESTAVVVVALSLALTEAIKSLVGVQDRTAQALAFVVGGLLGAGWYAAWYTQLVDPNNTALDIVGGALAVLAFALTPSGAYKFTMSAAGKAGGGK